MGLRPRTDGIDARVAIPPEAQRAMHDSAEPALLGDLCVLCDLCVTTLPPAREDIRSGAHPAISHSSTRHADIIVEQTVIVERKSVERILPVHEAQTMTYRRTRRWFSVVHRPWTTPNHQRESSCICV